MSGEVPDWSAPHFVQAFRGVRTRQGYDVCFAAVVSGTPTPIVSWRFNNGSRLLSHGEKHYQYYNPDTGDVSLTIRQLGPGDEGRYSCSAANPYGEVTATLNIDPESASSGGSTSKSQVVLSPDSARLALATQLRSGLSS